MIEYWMLKICDALDQEIERLDADAEKWASFSRQHDRDRAVAETLRVITRVVRRVVAS